VPPLCWTRFYAAPKGAAEKTLDLCSSDLSCHCYRVLARRHGAGDAFPAWPAKCNGLFPGRTYRAVVGAGVLDCRHGNFDAYDHRDSGHFLRREPDVPSISVLLSYLAPADRLSASSPLFFRRGFFPPPPARKTILRAPTRRRGQHFPDHAGDCRRRARFGNRAGSERRAGNIGKARGRHRHRAHRAVYVRGGMKAVIWTDVAQLLLYLTGKITAFMPPSNVYSTV